MRDFFKQRLSADELVALFAGRDPRKFLSKRSKKYKKLSLASANITEKELIELMVVDPTLIRRPLVVSGETIIVGFDQHLLAKLGKAYSSGADSRQLKQCS